MKKLFLSIVVLGLVLSGNAYAEKVLYCVDKLITGMEGDYSQQKNYTEEKFVVKIDLENKRLIIDGVIYNQIGDEKLSIFFNDLGRIIRLHSGNNKKVSYHRSSIFGMSDAIYIANGECSMF